MSIKTVSKHIRISEIQHQTLDKLSERGVNVSQFIRQSIKEKIKRDYPKLKPKKDYCPF